MSRNFELLQQAGRLHEISQPKEEQQRTLTDAPATSAPTLEMTSMARDEITKLVQRLFLIPKTAAPRSVVFTAPEAGNGCSWVCARVAELLASLVPGSVCLLDWNLRRPGLSQQFKLHDQSGLSEVASHNGDIRRHVRSLSLPNLSLLSCDTFAEGEQALQASDRVRSVLRELRRQFDYVIVDVNALDSGNTGIVLGGLADGAVLVLKANSSRKDIARKAMQDFQAAKVPILGVVLNRRTFPIPDAIYKHL
jgi:Mrp family chromosome partitioning ATPase